MEQELLKLYEQFLKDLDHWNTVERSPIDDPSESDFATFMSWLKQRNIDN